MYTSTYFIIKSIFAASEPPIFYECDIPMSKDLLFSIITKSNQCGFDLVAVIFYMIHQMLDCENC